MHPPPTSLPPPSVNRFTAISSGLYATLPQKLQPIGPGIWIARRFFSLGAGQVSRLKYSGLRQRLMSSLSQQGTATPQLNTAEVTAEEKAALDAQLLDTDPSSSSEAANTGSPVQDQSKPGSGLASTSGPTLGQLEAEERLMVSRMLGGEDVPFPLDTTMTVVDISAPSETSSSTSTPTTTSTRRRQRLCLISPTPWDEDLDEELQKLGQVSAIVAPNLQHWLFVAAWAHKYPHATIYLAPGALGESLKQKLQEELPTGVAALPQPADDWVELVDGGSQVAPCLEQRLLRGAPLNMNEILFFHAKSNTLIASDAFYGGYKEGETPSWFGRLWFKMTKKGYRNANLPIYRTSRVISDGDYRLLLDTVDDICSSWRADQIVFAHGSSPYKSDAQTALSRAWSVLADMRQE